MKHIHLFLNCHRANSDSLIAEEGWTSSQYRTMHQLFGHRDENPELREYVDAIRETAEAGIQYMLWCRTHDDPVVRKVLDLFVGSEELLIHTWTREDAPGENWRTKTLLFNQGKVGDPDYPDKTYKLNATWSPQTRAFRVERVTEHQTHSVKCFFEEKLGRTGETKLVPKFYFEETDKNGAALLRKIDLFSLVHLMVNISDAELSAIANRPMGSRECPTTKILNEIIDSQRATIANLYAVLDNSDGIRALLEEKIRLLETKLAELAAR
jgi:hypothetical protein